MKKIILLLILLPILDLYILVKASQSLGFLNTFLAIILTGIIGILLAISQGRMTIRNIRLEITQGQVPGNQLLNGLSILIGGLLLLTPGIITDVIGITMVLPGTRTFYRNYVKSKLYQMLSKGRTNIFIRW
ncbi:FxsA family protein [Tepidimicrobium xylanilyticum]|uniref:UPF0716 protein FxsA n=1 Tax=Tepidimicrobium xylanilyticum TaxID=1123352 RepID=A0A1H2UVC6_9FIRM|nr:FxsA family protein [Tepidimicrobium xylanilyticum]GMG96811.1 membrane protein FxsA [Tepidimicrobium xylanilyticum]SDW59534.1 UPF0716 protein FxsA [Tepidimicrobium xylanilyticum]